MYVICEPCVKKRANRIIGESPKENTMFLFRLPSAIAMSSIQNENTIVPLRFAKKYNITKSQPESKCKSNEVKGETQRKADIALYWG